MPRREARFTVNAPPEELWRFIRDFHSPCTCIPCVERIHVVDDRTAELTVREKVGVVPLILTLKAQIDAEETYAAFMFKSDTEPTDTANANNYRISEPLLYCILSEDTDQAVDLYANNSTQALPPQARHCARMLRTEAYRDVRGSDER